MGHALTSTAACQEADAMALEKARLGDGSQILECTRQALDSYDLTYKVRSAAGAVKSFYWTFDGETCRHATQTELLGLPETAPTKAALALLN